MLNGKLVDFHTHILPKIDDGPREAEVSVKMLNALYKQGVEYCVLTPHYLHEKESAERFVQRRAAAYERLQPFKEQIKMPNIALGAEVYLCKGVSDEDLRPLCMGKSNVLMVEFPATKFQYWMIDELERIAFNQNIDVMIAHVDRLLNVFKKEELEQILGFDNFIFQLNTEALYSFGTRISFMAYYGDGMPLVLGSDAHDMELRAPDMAKGVRKLTSFPFGKKIKTSVFETGKNVAEAVFFGEEQEKKKRLKLK